MAEQFLKILFFGVAIFAEILPSRVVSRILHNLDSAD